MFIALASAATACTSQPAEVAVKPPEPIAQTQCAGGIAQYFGATTDGDTALHNLDAQIDGREALAKRRPHDVSAKSGLVSLLLGRAQYRGTYEDFDRAFELAEAAVADQPNDAHAHALMATVLSAVHRFDDAMAELDHAQKLGMDVTERRDTIHLARGEDLEGVLARRRAKAEAYPGFTTLTNLAAAQMTVGDYQGADASFVAALEQYGDVSPLPVAWTTFQRGVMWSERAARKDMGCTLYRDGVTRLPHYVVANVHLAEIERVAEPGTAAARLESILPLTTDPEALGILAPIVRHDDPTRADALVAKAGARYEQLLDRYRLAFADHAAEFYMAAGHDPQFALELALENLDNRPNDRAFEVAIRAARAAGEQQLACDLADAAGQEPASVVLQQLQASLADSCG